MSVAALNARWLRSDMGTPEGQAFGKAVLNHMCERLSDYQEKYGALFNLEATPAEGITPVSFTSDVFKALDLQDELQTLYTFGTVFHAFLGEKLSDWEAAANLVKVIAENYKLPYYTLSPTYSVCVEHGYIAGKVNKCPQCGRDTEIYSRITGYYRLLKN